MLLTVNTDTQRIVSSSLGNTPVDEISVPRASDVPIWVQFSREGVVYDPEVLESTILTSSVANPTIITTDGAHGYSTGDSVTISGPYRDAAHDHQQQRRSVLHGDDHHRLSRRGYDSR
jgi:hypothetical protein